MIATRDNSIQKFLKLNGAGQANPKEEGYCKNVMANFDKAQIVQEEKVGLSEKAALLVSLPSISFPNQQQHGVQILLKPFPSSWTAKSSASTSRSGISKTKAPSSQTRSSPPSSTITPSARVFHPSPPLQPVAQPPCTLCPGTPAPPPPSQTTPLLASSSHQHRLGNRLRCRRPPQPLISTKRATRTGHLQLIRQSVGD